MRKHRLNLNLVCDADLEAFQKDVVDFVRALADPALLNLFIIELTDDDVIEKMYAQAFPQELRSPSSSSPHRKSVAELCSLVRGALEESAGELGDAVLTPILSTFLRPHPPDLEAALATLQRLAHGDEALMDLGVSHLLLMVRPEKLFSAALGTYDFRLVMGVAERSDADPKEFLPFLNGLRDLRPEPYRHYRIELHLERWDKALRHLALCDDSVRDELLGFLGKRPELFPLALELFSHHGLRGDVLEAFGDHLRGQPSTAAALYRLAGRGEKAFAAYARDLNWREMIALGSEDLEEELGRAADRLRDKRQFRDAATLYLQHLDKKKEAVECLCEAEEWMEALNIDEGLTTTRLKLKVQTIMDSLAKIQLEWEQKLSRLVVVREEKAERWGPWVESGGEVMDGTGDGAVSEVSEATTASGSSRLSSASARSTSTRKAERRRRNLKEGGRYEDVALLAALADLAAQADASQESVEWGLGALARLGEWGLGAELSEAWRRVEMSLRCGVDEAWPKEWPPHALPGPFHETVPQLSHTSTSIVVPFSLSSQSLPRPPQHSSSQPKFFVLVNMIHISYPRRC